MWRKSLLLTALLAMLAVRGTETAQAAGAGHARSIPAFGRSLDVEMIKAALKTATPEEDGFVQHVVDLVAAGRLPRSLVVSTFLWARRKPRWQFQYFKFGLTFRAGLLGIRI